MHGGDVSSSLEDLAKFNYTEQDLFKVVDERGRTNAVPNLADTPVLCQGGKGISLHPAADAR